MFPDGPCREVHRVAKLWVTKCHTGIFVLRSATRTGVMALSTFERIHRSFMSFLWLALSLFVCNIMDPGISASIEENRYAPLKCQCKKTLTLHSRDFSLQEIYWILSKGPSSNWLSGRFLTAQSSNFIPSQNPLRISLIHALYVRLAQMGIEDPSSHSGYRTCALGRQAQLQQRDCREVEDRE